MIPGTWWINESWGQPQRCIQREQARSLCFTIMGNKGGQQPASPASLIACICSRDDSKCACRFRGRSLSTPETIEQKPKGYMCLAIWGRCSENQGGSRIKKKCLGSNFLVKPHGLDLPTYVIRHMSIYGNITSSLWSLTSLNNLRILCTVPFRSIQQ